MRKNEEVSLCEYVAVYVDDLAFAMKDPGAFIEVLKNKYCFKLKGTGAVDFHLGCDFFRNNDGVLCVATRKYIERMVSGYKQTFGESPAMNIKNPLELDYFLTLR